MKLRHIYFLLFMLFCIVALTDLERILREHQLPAYKKALIEEQCGKRPENYMSEWLECRNEVLKQ